LTEEQKQDDGQKLFDFCAECLKTFIESNFSGENEVKAPATLPLGFTVSYARYCYLGLEVLTLYLVFLPLLVSLSVAAKPQQCLPNSSPVRQAKIDHGVLIRWTKGFGAPNTEGHDVAEMFRKSLEKYVCPVLSPTLTLLRITMVHCVSICSNFQ
jgi:hexokinase